MDEPTLPIGRRRRWVAVVAAAAAVAAIAVVMAVLAGETDSTDAAVVDLPDAATPYDGPLYVDSGRYGAAGEALACTPAAGQLENADVYAEGATSDSVEGALKTAVSEGLFLFAPTDDLRVARAEDERVMLTYEADDRILLALVFRDGPATEGAGGPGWYLEAAARCDFAEFPEAFAEKAGYQLWHDEAGEPAPVTKLYSAPGPEHCSWDSMVFLYAQDRHAYVREPTRELERFTAGPYRADIPLPDDASDTGYEREGRHLWLSADDNYVYVGSPRSVEAWPLFEAGCA